jgi:hypothetical protein
LACVAGSVGSLIAVHPHSFSPDHFDFAMALVHPDTGFPGKQMVILEGETENFPVQVLEVDIDIVPDINLLVRRITYEVDSATMVATGCDGCGVLGTNVGSGKEANLVGGVLPGGVWLMWVPRLCSKKWRPSMFLWKRCL